MNEWYESCIRYTLIAAADINGFIPCACHTVVRDEISDEGAAGTVDGDYFLYWVKNYLCTMTNQGRWCSWTMPTRICMMIRHTINWCGLNIQSSFLSPSQSD